MTVAAAGAMVLIVATVLCVLIGSSHLVTRITSEPLASTTPASSATPLGRGTDAQESTLSGRTMIFTAASSVTFKPNRKAFVDSAAAARALIPIARWLAVDPSRHAWVEGTTADVGSISGQVKLSRLRAEHVRDELIILGASPAQISAKGVGSNFPQFKIDRDSSGTLLVGPAALNRSVRITLRRAS